jgi:ATP-dependent Clp protease ATP-binding subunit ClpA
MEKEKKKQKSLGYKTVSLTDNAFNKLQAHCKKHNYIKKRFLSDLVLDVLDGIDVQGEKDVSKSNG